MSFPIYDRAGRVSWLMADYSDYGSGLVILSETRQLPWIYVKCPDTLGIPGLQQTVAYLPGTHFIGGRKRSHCFQLERPGGNRGEHILICNLWTSGTGYGGHPMDRLAAVYRRKFSDRNGGVHYAIVSGDPTVSILEEAGHVSR